MKKPVIVLVGKPNVGKSTLFNSLLGRSEAIVGEEFGLTRDYQKVVCTLDEVSFYLVDTAGITNKQNTYSNQLSEFTKQQINSADVLLFLIDSSKDLNSDDIYCSKMLRKSGKKIILLQNKTELKESNSFGNQGYALGHGIPLSITAKNKKSIYELKNEIKRHIKYEKAEKILDFPDNKKSNIRISISGRPNTGKSTLFNLINEKQRVVTGEKIGTTRDSVITEVYYKKTKLSIIDTAGMKKKGKIDNDVDKAASYYSRKEIRYANLVILVFDATMPFSNQDMNITNYIIEEGRSLILIFNKWDLIKNKNQVKREILSNIDKRLFDVKGVKCLFLSALDKNYKAEILDNIIEVNEIWNRKINTSELNNWLRKEYLDSKVEDYRGSPKIKYITQAKIRPPTFSIFCNNKNKINNTSRRNLENRIRKRFGFPGIPIRLNFFSSKNPYEKNNNRR